MILVPPIPSPISFHDRLQDPSNSHTRDLTDANAARARLGACLHATKKARLAEGRGADWAGTARAVAEYLPYLYAILSSVEADSLLLPNDPVFVWKSSLSGGVKSSRVKVALPSFHFELAATLLTYAICLSNAAANLVASLGSYEIASSVSSSSISVHDETVNQAADMLCRASGILEHLAQVVVPRWECAVGLESLRARPVEFTRDAATALSKMCLADANLLAIRRLLSRSISVAHSTTTPGPPLPPSHPSPSLLSKLHLQVYSYYDEARSLFKGSTKAFSTGSSSTSSEISPLIRRYLSDGRNLALALSYKWLGVDAGERSSTGDALGWLAASGKVLDEMKERDSGIKALRIGKGKGAAKGRKGKVQEDVESVQAFSKAYKKVNDTVHFQPVPSLQTLQAQTPSGRAALSLKPYSPPPPAFQTSTPVPGMCRNLSNGHSRSGNFGINSVLDDDSDDSSDEDATAGADEVGYFGAGQYF
ncbi:hypothetical protein JCM10212_006648 [Sporobolomyces blumeae]